VSGIEKSKLLLNPDGSARDRIVGFETEYGLTCDLLRKENDGLEGRMNESVANAARRLNGGHGEFNEDGNRHYVDVGAHPEFSTAEDVIFLDAAARLLAGHIKLEKAHEQGADCVNENQEFNKIKNVNLFANTCDARGESWASHENFVAARSLLPQDFIGALAVHRLSRIVWSGAGLVKITQNGKNFSYHLSEKADHIWDLANDQTTRARPLVNLRDEPLAYPGSYRRIHGTAGESVFSPFTNALRLASESIVLRAVELDTDFSDLMPENPVVAIKEISSDPSLKTKVELENGSSVSGLDLQKQIAERAIAAAMAAEYLTDQEIYWGNKWIELIDDLSEDSQNCINRLDWIVKRELIERELAARPNELAGNVAWQKAIEYHRLLPNEGAGMKLVRKGFFENSPDPDSLEPGPGLPSTRAKLRAEAIGRLKNANIYFRCDWEKISVFAGESYEDIYGVLMLDPWIYQNDRLGAVLEIAAA
jgi:proteasome accessory factor A